MNDWRSKHDDDRDLVPSEYPRTSASPGKSTLTSRLGGGVNAAQVEHIVMRVMRMASGAEVSDTAERSVARAQASSGAPLPGELRNQFAQSLGIDLDNVRVHTDSAAAEAARAVGAQAYTLGSDIYFGDGYYDPSSDSGKELLAHEVVHTVQQSAGAAGGRQNKLETSEPGDALEREADDVAARMVRGQAASVSSASGQLARKLMRRITSPGGIAVRNAIRGVRGSAELDQIIHSLQQAQQQRGDTVMVEVPGETLPVRRAEINELLTEARRAQGVPAEQQRPAPRRDAAPPAQQGGQNTGNLDGGMPPAPANQPEPEPAQPRRARPRPAPAPTGPDEFADRGPGQIQVALMRATNREEVTAIYLALNAARTPSGGFHHVTLTETASHPQREYVRLRPDDFYAAIDEAGRQLNAMQAEERLLQGPQSVAPGTGPLLPDQTPPYLLESPEEQAANDAQDPGVQDALRSFQRDPRTPVEPIDWTHDPPRQGPRNPPARNLSAELAPPRLDVPEDQNNCTPSTPPRESAREATTPQQRRFEPGGRSPQPQQPPSSQSGELTAAQRVDWQAYQGALGQMQTSWSDMRVGVQRYNVVSREHLEQLREMGISGGAVGQDMGSQVEMQHQASNQPNNVTVGELFDGSDDTTLNLGHGGEAGIERAQSRVRGTNQESLTADSALRRAMAGAESWADGIDAAQERLNAALSALRQGDRERDVETAQAALSSVEARIEFYQELVTHIAGIVRLAVSGGGSSGDMREVAGSLGRSAQTFVSMAFHERLQLQRARLSEAEQALEHEIAQGRLSNVRARRAELEQALDAQDEARNAVQEALNHRRSAYSNLGDAAGAASGTSGQTRNRIRQTIASVPLLELTLSHIQSVLQAIQYPTYSDAAGRGLALASRANHPSVGPFRLSYQQMRAYESQFQRRQQMWQARLDACQGQVDVLRGNDTD